MSQYPRIVLTRHILCVIIHIMNIIYTGNNMDMAKKAALLLLAMLLIALSACGRAATASVTETASAQKGEKTDHFEKVCVDIAVNDDGYYATYTDMDIHYADGEISWVLIDQPTLLAYEVSSAWDGGICLLSGKESKEMSSALKKAKKLAKNNGDKELLKELEGALSVLEESGPYKQQST